MGKLYLIVELDAKTIVDIFGRNEHVNDMLSPILDDYRMLITKFHQKKFKHCYRQANQCADALSRMGAEQEVDFRSFESPLVDVFNVFQ